MLVTHSGSETGLEQFYFLLHKSVSFNGRVRSFIEAWNPIPLLDEHPCILYSYSFTQLLF